MTLAGFQVTQFAIQSGRTSLAGMTPALAYGGAAQLSRANHPLKTRQALTILYFGETWSGSVIGFATSSGVTVDAGATIRTDASSLIQAGLATNWFIAEFSLVSAATLASAVDAVSVYAVNLTSARLAAIAAIAGTSSLVGYNFALTVATGGSDHATLTQTDIRPYASPERTAASRSANRNDAQACFRFL